MAPARNLRAKVALDCRAILGEGPVWNQREACLAWVDIPSHALHIFDPESGRDRTIDVGEPIGAVAPRRAGGWVLALERGFAILQDEGGPVEMVAALHLKASGMRLNDAKCDPRGRFWAGSLANDLRPHMGTLYRL